MMSLVIEETGLYSNHKRNQEEHRLFVVHTPKDR